MKVLHVITGLNVGGAENMLAKLIERGGADTPEVLSLLPPGPIAERITACGVKVHTLNMRRGAVGPAAMLRLPRMVEAIAPDLIHGWMYHGNLAASYARKRLQPRLPLVWNIRHSIPDLAMESRQTRILLKLSAAISRGPEAIVYNAHVSRAQHEAIGYSATRGMVIPNGFDTSRYQPAPGARDAAAAQFGFADGAFRIACIARLHPMKDHARLVEAVAAARIRGCDIHLVLVGHGLEEPPADLKHLIESKLPADRVTTCGARFDVADWLAGMDLLAVPSAWGEAFPNVIGEALACGVPVVATDVGDSARIVADDGIIVPPKDTHAMTEAILSMAALPPEKREAMGQAGRERVVRDYSLPKIGERYSDMHAACLEQLRQG
ncbi:glycosyltransferase [Aurantiacibacter rhizosphaerae]|uniref:Glycosyltransferase n=1 Tax=Aurantiacibacter rhizosphaerae TaxID=2691582 RepID=A0A844XAZ8_9SPHN|nr:glycosyltransferase [Aurantiacibacter rhizosphaerae]MWV27577.1 glycosyltransferase [Aurantiacibacter rhizosphaerae]